MPYKDAEKKKVYNKIYRMVHLDKLRAHDKAYGKIYREQSEVKERNKERGRVREQRPDVMAKRKAYRQTLECKEYQRIYHNQPDIKERARDRDLQRNYGITLEIFNSILAGQGGVCAICGTSDWMDKGPVVDHDHDSGVLRGILCGRCNTALGLLRHRPGVLKAGAAYLERT